MKEQLSVNMDVQQNKINIQLLLREKEPAYSEYVARHPEATPYHTLAWRDISCKVFGHAPYFLIAEAEEKIQGVMPLFLVKGIFGRRLVSVPLRDKGGPLCESTEVLEHLMGAAKNLMVELKCRYVHIKAWHGLCFHENTPDWLIQHNHFINSSVKLDNNPENIWNGFEKRSVQRPIKKSMREGVSCYWGKSLDDMKKFYRLLILTRKKLGVPPYGFDLFYEIWEKMIQNNFAGLLLAQYRGIVISGLVLFFLRDKAICGYAASDKNYLWLRPNNLMFWEAMKDACMRGCTCFDFGADSPDNQNLLSFKEGFGAVTKVLPHYYIFNGKQTSFAMDFDSRKYRLQRKLFSQLPLCISRKIGPIIARQLS